MRRKLDAYLSLRGETYWFKRDYPEALRPLLGGVTAKLENLHTGDIREARKRRDAVRQEFEREIATARSGERPTEADPVAALAEDWRKEREEYDRSQIGWSAKVLMRDPESLPDEEALNIADFIQAEGERVAKVHGANGGRRFINLVKGRAPVLHHLDAYLRELPLAPKTKAERKNLLNTFGRWAGEHGFDLLDISRARAGEYVTSQIAVKHRRTAKKHLTALKHYWGFLLGRGMLAGENPWERQIQPDKSKRVEREDTLVERPFTEAEMRTLLYSPFPSGMQKAHERQIADATRIAALSGLRLAEVVTLQTDECSDGFFSVRQGKTAAAVRRVPIHPDLVSIVSRRLTGKEAGAWLFDELSAERNPSDAFGKRFARYREALGVKDDQEGRRRSLVNFHSFRRWFATQAERAGQPESTISAVLGHTVGRRSLALRVYSGGPSEAQWVDCVGAVRLPTSD